MALNIKSPEVDALAREVAALMGVGITDAVRESLTRTKAALQADRAAEIARKRAAILAIVEKLRDVPIIDTRSEDEILGYNEFGTFD